MTRSRKIILTGILLASAAAVAGPTIAAQFPPATAKDESQVTSLAKEQQVADAGDWRGPRWRHFGAGPYAQRVHGFGQGFGGGPGGPGFMWRAEFLFNRMLDFLGLDSDGKVTPAQIDTAAADKFKSYDKNGDGKITLDEYQAFWMDVTHERMVRSFQRLDNQGAGYVTLDEVQKPLNRVLKRLDHNGDGTIDQADFQRGPRGMGGMGGMGGPAGAPPAPPAGPDGSDGSDQ